MTDRTITENEIKALLAISGYTPGPWNIVAQERCGLRSTEYYHEVWDNNTNVIVEEVTRVHNDGGSENIRLIAASPDLQAALRQTFARALAAEAEVERMRGDREKGAQDYCDLMEQRDQQHVQIAKLEDALRPFVEYVHDDLRRGKATYELVAVNRHGGGLIGSEDLRRARAALKETSHD